MRKTGSRMISLILAVLMIVTALPVDTLAEDDILSVSEDEGYAVNGEDDHLVQDDDYVPDSTLEEAGNEASVAGEEALVKAYNNEASEGDSDVLKEIDDTKDNEPAEKADADETAELLESEELADDAIAEDTNSEVTEEGAVSSSWLKYYNYDLSEANKQVIIKSSNGKFTEEVITEITVPAQTVIDGVVYNTVLENERTYNYYNLDLCGLWYPDRDVLTSVTIEDGVIVAPDSSFLFANLYRLTELDISGLDTSRVSHMGYMFYNLSKLQKLDLSSFDTSSAIYMDCMFCDCSSIGYLDLSSFNTERVIDMSSMFSGMTSVQEIILTSFDTSLVNNMSNMFRQCYSLMDLDLTGFNTVRVTSFSGMFENLSSHISTLDLRNFCIRNDAYTDEMFLNSSTCNLYLGVNTISNRNSEYPYAYDLENVYNIYYEGSQEQWNNLNNWVYDKTEVYTDYHGDVLVPSVTPDRGNAVSTSWYKGYYDYYLVDRTKKLVLTGSTGKFKSDKMPEITVPAQTRINGTVYTTVLDSSYSSLWSNDADILTSIIIEEGVEVSPHCSYLFYNLPRLSTLDISGLNTRGAVNMAGMFQEDHKLKELNLSNFDTSAVRYMDNMFSSCSSIETLDLTSFDTAHTMSMYQMFANMSSLLYVDLTSFDTSRVTNMGYMFYYCSALMELDLNNFITKSVTDFGCMFYGLSRHISTLDLRNFYFGGNASVNEIFKESGIINLYLPRNCVSNYYFGNADGYLFTDNEIANIYYPGTEAQWNVFDNNVSRGTEVIYNYSGEVINPRRTVNKGGAATSKWYEGYYDYYIDRHLDKLVLKRSVGKFVSDRIPEVRVPAQTVIDGVVYTTVLDSCGNSLWSEDSDIITTIIIEEGVEAAPDCSHMFAYLPRLSTLDITGIDTSNVVYMDSMFEGCNQLISLDLSNFNTSQARSMAGLFGGCTEISSLDLYSFDTGRVIHMGYMFSNMSGLRDIELSSFDTSNVIRMNGMFSGCSGLCNLDVSGFNTVNVVDFNDMFYEISPSIQTLDLRSFSIGNSASTNGMLDSNYVKNIYLAKSTVENYSFNETVQDIYYEGTNIQWTSLNNYVPDGCTVHCEYVKSMLPLDKTTVYFDANGGSVGRSKKTISIGSVYGIMPVPVYTGHEFAGWYTSRTGGSEVTDATEVTLTDEHTLYAHWDDVEDYVAVSGISLEPSELVLKLGKNETGTLTAKVLPVNATDQKVIWSSSDETKAEVDGTGVVTAISPGKVTVYARTEEGGFEAVAAVTVQEADPVLVTKVTLNKNQTGIEVGASEKLTAVVAPEDATNKKVNWTSSNTSVATVDSNGRITAQKAGTATITAKADDGSNKFDSCVVTVTPIAVTAIYVDASGAELDTGETFNIVVTVYPEGASVEGFEYESSAPAIAAVSSDGVVTAVSPGTAEITVTEKGSGKSDKFTVTVRTIAVTGVYLNTNYAEIYAGQTYTLTADVVPENATDKRVTWVSSNTEAATVQGGVITAVAEGEAVITVQTVDGEYTDECTVKVIAAEPDVTYVTGVTISPEQLTLKLKEGETVTDNLSASILPEDATNKAVIWNSGSPSIAEVDENGVVTALSAGTTEITVTTVDGGYTDTCEVTVEEADTEPVDAGGITLDKTYMYLWIGHIDSGKLTAAVLPEDAQNKDVTWASDNEGIASVDENGNVTAVAAGRTKVTASSVDGKHTAECEVYVEAESYRPDIDEYIDGEEIDLESYLWDWNCDDAYIISKDSRISYAEAVYGPWTIRVTFTGYDSNTSHIIITDGSQRAYIYRTLMADDAYYMYGEDDKPYDVAVKLCRDDLPRIMDWITRHRGGGSLPDDEAYRLIRTNEEFPHHYTRVTGVSVSPAEIELRLGESAPYELSVTVSPEDANNKEIIWKTSNSSIATVYETEDGIAAVTAVAKGVAVITATSADDGSIYGTCKVKVVKTTVPVEHINLDKRTVTLIKGKSVNLIAEAFPADAEAELSYSTDNENVVQIHRINNNGSADNNTVSLYAAGKGVATITVSAGGKSNKCIVTVVDDVDEKDIPSYKKDALWIGVIDDETYGGGESKPQPNVYYDCMKLKAGTDYKLSYKNNKNAGRVGDKDAKGKLIEPTITVTFKGDYEGQLTKGFNILPAAITDAQISDVFGYVKMKKDAYVQQQLSPTVEFKGKKLKQGKDYTLTYGDEGGYAAPGSYKITVNGTGNFSGTTVINEKLMEKEKTVSLKSVKIERTDGKGSLAYTGSPIKPKYRLYYTDKATKQVVVLTEDTDYEIYYSDNVNPGTCKVIFAAKGDKFYGTASDSFKIEVIKQSFKNNRNLEVIFDGCSKDANGIYEVPYLKGGAMPAVTVKLGGKELTEGTDYKVSYKNNKKLSSDGKQASVVLTAMGDYKDSYTLPFNVVAQDMARLNIVVDDFAYSNKPNAYRKAKIKIYDVNGKQLSASDYYIDTKTKLSDNKDWRVPSDNETGTPEIPATGSVISVTAHGKGLYSGDITGSFKIADKGMLISSATVAFREGGDLNYNAKNKAFVYAGKAVEPDKANMTVSLKVKVKEGNKTVMKTINPTYEIVGYESNTKKGTAKVTIRGTGEYGGLKTVSFKITGAK